MIDYHKLHRADIQKIWSIDRTEKIEAQYYFQSGELKLRAVKIDVSGWPVGEPEKYTPILERYYELEGWLYGAFDRQTLVGIVVLGDSFISAARDQLELKFLYVDREYRKQLLGQSLFNLAVQEAAKRDAKSMYISATPTKRTIDFYIRMGCILAKEPDAKLYELEPEDIHLEYYIENGQSV